MMIKTLRSVGNSKAVILPSDMIKKYGLENKISIEETEDGILISAAVPKSSYQKSIEKLRKNKTAIYKRMEAQANEPETIAYYASHANNFSDVETDIIEE